MNVVNLVGRLTKEIEIRVTPTGKKVAVFTVAVRKNKDITDFINCVAWDHTAEYLQRYAKKGMNVAVTGRLANRNYEKDGRKVYVTEVITENASVIFDTGIARNENPRNANPSYETQNPSYNPPYENPSYEYREVKPKEEQVTFDDLSELPFY